MSACRTMIRAAVGSGIDVLEAKRPRMILWHMYLEAHDMVCLEGAGNCFWCWCIKHISIRTNIECEQGRSWDCIQAPVYSPGEDKALGHW